MHEVARAAATLQVGFVLRVEGGRLAPALLEELPGCEFAFEAHAEVGAAALNLHGMHLMHCKAAHETLVHALLRVRPQHALLARLQRHLHAHVPANSMQDGLAWYYHTDTTRQLTARFGDMLYRIRDLEVRGTHSLTPCNAGPKTFVRWMTNSSMGVKTRPCEVHACIKPRQMDVPILSPSQGVTVCGCLVVGV
jgi:hypothetical protein